MKKLKFIQSIIVIVCFCNFGLAQTQNKLWSLPSNSLKFPIGLGSYTPLPTPAFPAYGYGNESSYSCSNAMTNAQGKLLFSINNGFIYNDKGYLLDILENDEPIGSDTRYTGLSEVCIVPDPVNCQRYYLFYAGMKNNVIASGGVNGNVLPRYSILDLSIPSYNNLPNLPDSPPMGALVNILNPSNHDYVSNKVIDMSTFTDFSQYLTGNISQSRTYSSYYAAIKNEDANYTLFIFVNSAIFKYTISSSGIQFVDAHTLPYGINTFGEKRIPTELEVVKLGTNGYRLGIPILKQVDQAVNGTTDFSIYSIDLDNNFNFLSSTEKFIKYADDSDPNYAIQPFPRGIEFSPDGNIVYITHGVSYFASDAIQYYDFSNPNAGVQPFILPTGINDDNYQYSQIELGQDGKLYFVGESNGAGNRLSTLNFPNTPTASNNWTNSAIPIGYAARYGTEDVSYNNPDDKGYTLPDQIDGMDYSARFTQNLECCLNSRDYGIITYNASGTAVWNSASDINGLSLTGNTVTVQTELRIKAGASITIKNMIFKFAPGARVIIDKGNGNIPGGKLTMDNTVFTVDDDCDINNLLWLGVQVWGDAGATQIPTNNTRQGQLIMQNNSVIEHAQIGAMASRKFIPQSNPWLYSGQPYDNNYNGGIIIAENSSFHNNLNDVEIKDYTAPAFVSGSSPGNRSVFKNCHFYTDNYLIHLGVNYNVGHHVELRSVQAVNFYGCDFENTVPQLYNTMSSRGDGIIAYNSKFSVDNLCGFPCVNPDFSEFKNLYSAINAASSNGLHTALVNNAKFYNNPFGITLSHINIATITSNYFEVSPTTYTLPVMKTYGLYMTNCTGYHVENNYFTHYPDPILGNAGTSYGIVVDNSGPAHNEIYRNTFIDLRVGVQAQNTNSSYYNNNTANAAVGLQILCNTFKEDMSLADITVSSGSIDYQQGFLSNSANSLAGNIFSHSHHNEESDFMMGMNAKFLNYSYNPSPNPTNPPILPISPDDDYTPFYYTHQIVTNQLPLSNEVFRSAWTSSIANTCPSRLNRGIIVVPVGVPISVLLQLKRDSLSGVIAEKESHFDGGNTSDLLTAIATQSSGNLKNTLMNASPYLTDTVLSGYLGTNPSNGLLKQVVIANSPVSSKIAQVIDNMNLPHGIQKQIDNAQTGISARRYLEGEIAYSKALKTNYFYEHIRLFLFDTISPNPMDSIAEIVKKENLTDEMRKLLFSSYEQMPDSGRASTQRQEIITAGTCQHFEEMSSIELQLLSVNSIGDAINSDTLLKAQLNSIAGCTDACCSIRATCMLLMAQDSIFIPLIEDIEPLNSAIGLSNSGSMESNEETSALSIFPNPTNNGTVVTIALDSKDETLTNATVEVYSITGQLMLKQAFEGEAKSLSLQPGALHPGVYFVKLISEGTIIETKKLLVER